MTARKLLAGTAIATTLLAATALPAAAVPSIPLGGYSGPVQLNFQNFESFVTAGGALDPTGPHVGDKNFGIFFLQGITAPGNPTPLWSPGSDGNQLVGVFNDITVKTVTNPGAVNEKTTNSGGVFQLYQVPTAQFLGDLGTGGYAAAGGGCTLGQLCYHGISDTAGGNLVLTMTLTGGVSPDPTVTLAALLDGTDKPPTGSALFNGKITGDPQFGPLAGAKDSFCPNADVTTGTHIGCPGADGTDWLLASQDPIVATVASPEPASLAVLGSGLLSLGLFKLRRRKNGPHA